jgi:hypothetical protein
MRCRLETAGSLEFGGTRLTVGFYPPGLMLGNCHAQRI